MIPWYALAHMLIACVTINKCVCTLSSSKSSYILVVGLPVVHGNFQSPYWCIEEHYIYSFQEEKDIRRPWISIEAHSSERNLISDGICTGNCNLQTCHGIHLYYVHTSASQYISPFIHQKRINAGLPSALAIDTLVAVGTTHGLVYIFGWYSVLACAIEHLFIWSCLQPAGTFRAVSGYEAQSGQHFEQRAVRFCVQSLFQRWLHKVVGRVCQRSDHDVGHCQR